MTAQILLSAVLGALIFRIRGGGFFPLPATWLARLVYALYTGAVVYVALRADWREALILATAATALAYLTIILGWGEWMQCGNDPSNYKARIRVAAIDWVLLKTFGPLWRPAEDVTAPDLSDPSDHHRFDCIDSPTGKVRPKWWREWRDSAGMALRGLIISVPMGGAFAIVGHPNGYALMAVGALMGPAYWVGNNVKCRIENFRTGPELAEAFWGFCWFGAMATALARG